MSNAKSFNEKSSEVFSDAEKVRKLVVAWMTQNNPAYDDPSYTPFATPVPDGWQARIQRGEDVHDIDAEGETDPEEAAESTERPAAVVSTSSANPETRRASSTPAVQDAEGAGEGFEGNTFQQAQEKIMTEMINLKNEEFVFVSCTSGYLLIGQQRSNHFRSLHKPSIPRAQGLLQNHKASCVPEEFTEGSTGNKGQGKAHWSYTFKELAGIRRRSQLYLEQCARVQRRWE